MKITAWNVNSIRSRLDRVLAWLDRWEVDVLGLQETKVVDDDFPREPFEERGYHVEVFGQKTYNGVAILAREQPANIVRGFGQAWNLSGPGLRDLKPVNPARRTGRNASGRGDGS